MVAAGVWCARTGVQTVRPAEITPIPLIETEGS